MIAERQSISIRREWLEKLREEAIGAGKSHYALAFNFGGDSSSKTPNFYIITEQELLNYNNYLQEE
jgi:hypothetical protein